MSIKVKTRLSLRELELDENSQKRNDFLKALHIVKQLPADNPSSFWSIASYCGMPYKKQPVPPDQILPNDQGNSAWDGYCQRSNVLFPTWNRLYCLKLEQSLQASLPDGDVMLPYWDQTSEANIHSGLPPMLLEKTVTIDGNPFPNPLLSFTLPEKIPEADNSDANAKYYVKPKGYTTVRYPFSGISNPAEAKKTADEHNQHINGLNTDPDAMLADNVRYWLTKGGAGGNIRIYNSIVDEYQKALELSSYNKFSHTSPDGSDFSLEQANNEIHLSVGGFSSPFVREDGSVKVDDDGNVKYFGRVPGANGDMGENETAAFDPCFFMHHCNVDRMFWVWQKKWGHTTSIPLEESSTDTEWTNSGQGPTPYQTPEQQLNFQTALHPFTNFSTGAPMTSSDCFNIGNLGYEYSIGSLDKETWPATATPHKFVEIEGKSWKDVVQKLKKAVQAAKKPLNVSFDSTHFAPATPESPIIPLQYTLTDKGADMPMFVKLGRDRFRVRNYLSLKNINKNNVDGSFVVQAYYKKAGKLHYIGQRGVLSRWKQEVCGNCMQHPNMAVCFAVDHILPDLKDLSNIVVIIASKDPETGKLIQTRVGQGEQVVHAAGKGSFKPTIHLMTSYEQELLGDMEHHAVT